MEIVGLVVLYVLGSFFATGFFFVTRSNRRADRLGQAWRAYAARRHYAFVAHETPERPFRITGSRGGLDFVLEVDARRDVVTRLIARVAGHSVGSVVASRGLGRRRAASQKMATGDVSFDRLFEVCASDAGAMPRVLPPETRTALQRFPVRMVGASLRLAVIDGQVIVEWAGGEVDPTALDAAHGILRRVCLGAQVNATRAPEGREAPAASLGRHGRRAPEG